MAQAWFESDARSTVVQLTAVVPPFATVRATIRRRRDSHNTVRRAALQRNVDEAGHELPMWQS